MNRLLFLSMLSLCSWQSSYGQHFKKHIVYLASDSLHGRAPGTDDEQQAMRYIREQIHPHNKVKSTVQKFTYTLDSLKIDTAYNIISSLDNRKDKTIIFSAHYDHLGFGNSKSKEVLQRKIIHNGADDNASGVSFLLELENYLSKQKKTNYNYVFLYPSAHEVGLYGSLYYYNHSDIDFAKVALVCNVDMVGRLDPVSQILKIGERASDSLLLKKLSAFSSASLHIMLDHSNLDQGDLRFFCPSDVSIMNITTGTHDDYHRGSDDENKINYEGMKAVFVRMKLFLNNY